MKMQDHYKDAEFEIKLTISSETLANLEGMLERHNEFAAKINKEKIKTVDDYCSLLVSALSQRIEEIL